jgi:hypothetical protein
MKSLSSNFGAGNWAVFFYPRKQFLKIDAQQMLAQPIGLLRRFFRMFVLGRTLWIFSYAIVGYPPGG